jgi:hypothetical protein
VTIPLMLDVLIVVLLGYVLFLGALFAFVKIVDRY